MTYTQYCQHSWRNAQIDARLQLVEEDEHDRYRSEEELGTGMDGVSVLQ